DAGLLAFTGDPHDATWLEADDVEALLSATPTGNVSAEQAREFVAKVVDAYPSWSAALDEAAAQRAAALLDAHKRVREGAQRRASRTRVEPQLPPDVLGVYVLLPQAGGR